MYDTSLGDTSSNGRKTLRDLPFAARLTIATFLASVGIGYFSAMVQLHFQHAKPGSVMPTPEEAVSKFHGPVGEAPKSRIVRLIEASEKERFNGTGQMSAAFTTRTSDFRSDTKRRAKAINPARKPTDEELAKAEADVRKEREGEKLTIVAWLQSGADKEAYDDDKFYLPEGLIGTTVTQRFTGKDEKGTFVKIKEVFTNRCVRCHMKEGGEDANAATFPLEKYEQIVSYNKVEVTSAMSLTKLAQTTHVHLLGFSMLYGLTGLIFALTSYWAILRVPLAPLPLIAQVVDISFWWLARLEAPYGPMFAMCIPISGAVVGGSLGLQILLSLWDLFGKSGKVVLVLLILTAGAGGYVVKEKVIDPHMAKERAALEAPSSGTNGK